MTTIHRTFSVPLRDNTSGFNQRYNISDVGLNPHDFSTFSYMDLFGLQYPSEKDITKLKSGADRVYCSHFVTDESPEYIYRFRVELTSLVEIPSENILKLVSLPDIMEVDTTLYHMSHILKSALLKGQPTDDILNTIRSI